MAESHRQRGEDQPDVGTASDVIRNDQHWTGDIPEMFATHDARVAEDLRGGPDQRVVRAKPQPADELALCPSRVNVLASVGSGLLQESLNVSNRFCIRKGGFVEFHVKLFLQGAQKFDTVKGGQGS